MMHGVEACAAGFIASSPSSASAVPNLVVTAANILEVYAVRAQEDKGEGGVDRGLMDGIISARLELICHYRLQSNVESIAILSGSEDQNSSKRDSIVVTSRDAKITVLEFDDSLHSLRTSSILNWRFLEGPRGRESFPVGHTVKADPQGRVAGVLIHNLQMLVLKSAQASLVGEEEMKSTAGKSSVRVESSYIINLRELEINHVKDFIFVHGYIEPVLVILHEKEPTWAGRLTWKNNTCMVSALSINTTLKQHPLIWSTSNLPHDAYKLLAVPPPLGGVLVISTNAIFYHNQSGSCSLGMNNLSSQPDGSLEMPKSHFSIEMDAANATWVSSDVALFISKTGQFLLLSLVNDGRAVLRLDVAKSKASLLTSSIANVGNLFFFLGNCTGESILVQYTSTMTQLHDEKSFSFVVRDSLINAGAIKDYAYGLRENAIGPAKQSSYEQVCCSGHGKNSLQKSIRPELITEAEMAGCKGIWTVYHKNSRDASKSTSDEEYRSSLIVSLENRTMVLERERTGDLGDVTETVDYYVNGSTIAAGNLFGRRRVVQIYGRGARVLDGSYMTQELIFSQHISEPPAGVNSEPPAVSFVSIADPYVLLTMTDGSIHLLIGDSATCTITLSTPQIFSTATNSTDKVSSCTLYSDAGPHMWLRSTSSDVWPTNPTDSSSDTSPTASADVYCLICYDTGKLEIYEIPGFKPVFTVNDFISGHALLTDGLKSEYEVKKEEHELNLRAVEIVMHKWPGWFSKPYLFGILNDGTLLCYRAYFYEKVADVSTDVTVDVSGDISRLRIRFIRIVMDDEMIKEGKGEMREEEGTRGIEDMQDWSSELITEVLNIPSRFNDLIDYLNFSLVCQNWRNLARSSPQPPQFPWLLKLRGIQPYKNGQSDALVKCVNIISNKKHRFSCESVRRKVLVSSCGGGCVVAHTINGDDNELTIVNPVTNGRVGVPDLNFMKPLPLWADAIDAEGFLILYPMEEYRDEHVLCLGRMKGNNWIYLNQRFSLNWILCCAVEKGKYVCLKGNGETEITDIVTQEMESVIPPVERPVDDCEEHFVQSPKGLARVMQYIDRNNNNRYSFKIFRLSLSIGDQNDYNWVEIKKINDETFFLNGQEGFALDASPIFDLKPNQIFYFETSSDLMTHAYRYDIESNTTQELCKPSKRTLHWFVPQK